MSEENILSDFKSDLPSLIEFTLEEELGSNTDPEEIPVYCEDISQNYRLLAICNLLVDVDIDGYFECLSKSAMTRLYFLQCCDKFSKTSVVEASASRSDGFFDALAVGRFDVACEISNLTAKTWMQEDEYEDDFCYAHWLNYFVSHFDNYDKDYLISIISKFEKYLEGKDNARLALCKAFIEKNQLAFEDAFDDLIGEHEEAITKERDLYSANEMCFLIQQHVFIEGLAILNVAEKIGFETKKDYKYCPHFARASKYGELPLTGYPVLR